MPQPRVESLTKQSLAVQSDPRLIVLAPIINAGNTIPVTLAVETLSTCLTASASRANTQAQNRDTRLIATTFLHAERSACHSARYIRKSISTT